MGAGMIWVLGDCGLQFLNIALSCVFLQILSQNCKYSSLPICNNLTILQHRYIGHNALFIESNIGCRTREPDI